MFVFISNSTHYKEMLSRDLHVKDSLGIGTAKIEQQYDRQYYWRHRR